MSDPNQISRRDLLQLLSAGALLPLSASWSGPALARPGQKAILNSVSFSPMAAPTLADPAAMATTTVGSVLSAHFSDGTRTDFRLSYAPFFITGDLVPDGRGGQVLAGGYHDIHGRPIIDRSVASQERQFFSDSPDGTSLLRVPGARVEGVKGQPVFAVVQFEYTSKARDGKTAMYGKLPSPIAVLTLDQDPATGRLKLVKYHNVDTSGVHGLWITCGASLSPWNTHLSSEEYEPDAFAARDRNHLDDFSRHLYGDPARANPYHYGHLPEVTVRPDGTASIRKHYCLGRLSHELVQVMPDERTVLMGDDATNSGYFVFVADRPRDLSAGTLYVARVGAGFSLDPAAAAASLGWIRLGHASSAEILRLADTLQARDILDLATSDPGDASYRRIVANGRIEWIRVRPGMEQAAAFLETHRYAAYVGASMGFTKMEGTTVNVRDKLAYSALQNIEKSMVAGDPLNVPGNGVAVPKALKAGAVMVLSLKGGLKDESGAAIDSDWMPADLKALLTGEDMGADALGNTARVDRIANPDNLKFSEQMRTLFIGEDSSQHVNNFLWAYQIDTRQLARVMSVPAGAESTGLHAVDELNGWTYIMSNFQHPGDWPPGTSAEVKAEVGPLLDARYKGRHGAAVGYLTAETAQVRLQRR